MGDINIDWDDKEIEDIFRDCGETVTAKHPIDNRSGFPAKYCFVEFETTDKCERFLEEFNGKKIPGSKQSFMLKPRHARGGPRERPGG
ncbi:unnamed protein product, partial [Heterosigma akashiwo]